ncbi:hypothetical protein N9I41_05570 [Flavobacteriaceae bacterium]|nr:hypothetical protein [Flavobacteriaceae bacterium]
MLLTNKNSLSILVLTLFLSQSIFSQKINYKREGKPYYPEQKLSESDSLKWPLILEVSIEVKDITDLSYKSNRFRSKILKSVFSKYGESFITKLGDSIYLPHDELVTFETDEISKDERINNDISYFNSEEHPYLFDENNHLKSIELVEAPIALNWNFRSFPFDTQKLVYRFKAKMDTSTVRLIAAKINKSSFSDHLPNLQDGYKVTSIDYSNTFETDQSDLIQTAPDEFRPLVTETLEIILNLSRNGSWLFFKLFIGGILSYLLSCFMFLIPKEEFEAKMSIAVGSIFGAIGNRYFVDSSLSGVQVLTKSDVISNLIIFMVALNVLAIILQRSKKINFVYLESEKYDFFYSIYYFTVLLIAIVLW